MSRKKWFQVLFLAFIILIPPTILAQSLVESDQVIGTILQEKVILFNKDAEHVDEIAYSVDAPGNREHLICYLCPGQCYNVYCNGQLLFGGAIETGPEGTLCFRSEGGGNFCVTQGVPPLDTSPPVTHDHLPRPGSSDAPISTNIVVHVSDNGCGVDVSSLSMTVEGETVTPSISGESSHYILCYNPSLDFDYAQTVDIVIEAQDLADPPNAMAPDCYSFVTKTLTDTSPPEISEISVRVTNRSATIDWITNEPATSLIEYGTTSEYGSFTPIDYQLVIHHRMELNNLMPGTAYHFKVVSSDGAGNLAASEDGTFTTDSSPIITKEWGDGAYTDHPGTCLDTYISVGAKTTNFSDDPTTLNTYTWPANSIANAILIQWDLSAIPGSATIIDAELRLYLCRAGGDTLYHIPVHKVINNKPVISTCNWNTYDGVNSWSGGNDGGQSDIAPLEDISEIDAVLNEYKSWTVTEMVADWVEDPTTNYGMMVNSDDQASRDSWRYFVPTENDDPERRPRLIITYRDNSGWDEEETFEPSDFALAGNFPNPFNAATVITYSLPCLTDRHTTLKIYNPLGQEVRTLLDEPQLSGYHEVLWDGRDDAGRAVASGIYICRLRSGNYVRSSGMALIR